MKILTVPNPILRQKAKVVSKIDGRVTALITAMVKKIDETKGPKGIGLAAPQVGELLRIILAREIKERGKEGELFVLVNPKIKKTSKKTELGIEGCLSVPGLYGFIERPYSIKIEALSEKNRKVKRSMSGLFARIIQHEVDHLDGVLFTDKVKGKLYTAEQLEKLKTQKAFRK